MMRKIGYIFLFFILLAPVYADDQAPNFPAPLFTNLGTYHRPISTTNVLAQRYFNQGLVFYYAFEWNESIRSFQAAAYLDPNCAMCYWGLALALGTKANAPMTGHEYMDAQTALKMALKLAPQVTPIERAYINTLSFRYRHPPAATDGLNAMSCHVSGAQSEAVQQDNLEYAITMKRVMNMYPNDNDAKALYAAALFDVIDWKFWGEDEKINLYTPEIIRTLQAALAQDKFHPGANHYYLQVLGESPYPANALDNAMLLKTLVPGTPHLIHIPSHIYFLTGRYHEGTEANLQAIATYKKYGELCHSQGFEPGTTYLYQHDFDFLRTTAAMEGRKGLALSAAQQLKASIPATWLEHDSQLQWFLPVPYFVEARFALWDDILKEPMPEEKYQYAQGMWHYARGMSYAYRNELDKAEEELNKIHKIIQIGAIPSVLGKTGIKMLQIADEVLEAVVADMHDGRDEERSVFAHLKNAAQMQDELNLTEPPAWYFPLYEALGAAYLKWKHPAEAEAMFAKDLQRYPANGWALYGLAKSLRQLGQDGKAKQVEEAYREAWKYADISMPVLMF